MLIRLVSIIIFLLSGTSFALDLAGNVFLLPVALEVPEVKNFILRNPRPFHSVGVTGLGCGGNVGCGEAAKGKANWAVTLGISFVDHTKPRNQCVVYLDVLATRYPDDSLEFTGEVMVDELNTDKGCAK